MGFDLVGVKPRSEKGDYFRANVWGWRPIWIYTNDLAPGILTEEDYEQGWYNNGYVITREKAEALAKVLKRIGKEGIQREHEKHEAYKESLPDEECDICKGTGKREDMEVANGCNKCQGKGKVRPFSTWYTLWPDLMWEFIEFMEDSGGFSIG